MPEAFTRPVIFALALVVPLAACQTTRTQTAEDQALADRLHAAAMSYATKYVETKVSKAMIACIDWRHRGGADPKLVWLPWTYVGEGSDLSIFVTELENDAVTRCERTAAKENWDCTCQTIDRNGRNVLRIP